ncbi:ABC transporter ATP-binding protein [Streptomyces sp. NRRL B-1347]|uniref:ABC transporter ATP-binding protein n=1 Tax=Streptomyces sp. NRRL B-1347 TaxID=1476877 RepID=UPI0004CB69A9|nr:ABC transporter ATP-binding protein [Streptomyces sp. NRRL B-1347]
MTTPILQLTGLSRTYQFGTTRRTVLKDVTYSFEQGRMYSVIGPSGSGKTTLLRGSVRFKGEDVAEIGLGRYRNRHVATVFQSLNLLTYMTAVQNITSAMEITGVKGVNRKKRAAELLGLLGVEEPDRHRRTLELSDGQQQRVAIARALACEVDILFADEPTGSLDQDTAEEIIEAFRTLAHDDGKSVILVTHSREVADASDEVIRRKRGKLMTV